ncbi:Dyp-type peroxidase [Nucisporomicrobium flavum]|uniref:Dyp-type peroxidase n=1 Tax=Nucisporomicrobium flavum TaxID=2785915 RepID=UPI003C2C17A5
MLPDAPIGRRALLAGAAATAASVGAAACSAPRREPVAEQPPAGQPAAGQPAAGPVGPVVHQPGIVSPPLPAVVLTAYDATAADRPALTRALRELARSVPAAVVTVALGASLFDGRYGLSRPRLLTTMPEFPGDVLDPSWCHGDVLVQAAATDARALRLPAIPGLRQRWRIDGFHPRDRGAGVRNLFGFREGAGNPEAADPALMNDLVWVQPGDGEPAWCTGGSYLTVRLIRLAMSSWEREPRDEQERVFGRDRDTGAPLGQGDVDYAADPDGRRIALDAHVRRANPGTAESQRHRILRRGWSYRRGEDAGQIFTCYQRDVERGFAAIQQRLTGEALAKYLLPFGGGYYFVPAADRLSLG